MTPKAYCKKHKITASEFGRRIGVSKHTACRLVAETHQTTPQRAIEIERLTNGEVTRQDLLPDFFGPAPDTGAVAENETRTQGEGPQ